MLLIAGAYVNAKMEKGLTPLMIAGLRGHTKLLRLLMELEAGVEAKDEAGKTARVWAEKYGKHAVVQKLRDFHEEVGGLLVRG